MEGLGPSTSHSIIPLSLDPIQESNLNPLALVWNFNLGRAKRELSNAGQFIVSPKEGPSDVCNEFLQVAQVGYRT